MPFLLRKIRKSKWYKHNDVRWLKEGELQADALGDLITTDNSLSLWRIEDDRSNLNQVVAALAANVHFISNLDYALFNQQIITEINIKFVNIKGDSPDEQVNSWHYDLIELSASKIMELAKAIQTKAEKKRIQPQEVLQLVAEGISSGCIDRVKMKLKPEAIEKIEKVIASKNPNNVSKHDLEGYC